VSAVDLSPLFRLRLRTPRLELRLPLEEELVELARLAEQGVHPRAEMPFLVPWTDGAGSPSFVDDFVRYHLDLRARWRRDDWNLELGVWTVERVLLGVQGVYAKRFAERRTVGTGSWLGESFQRQGYGTEMRAAILELAFAGLGAVAAESGALDGNVASAAPRGVPVREQRFLLERDRWRSVERPPVEIVGLEPCLPLFGR
jgi:RimJ/RimL family protein N-acetyltransferase